MVITCSLLVNTSLNGSLANFLLVDTALFTGSLPAVRMHMPTRDPCVLATGGGRRVYRIQLLYWALQILEESSKKTNKSA